MNTMQGRSRLVKATKELKSQWLKVQEDWRDEQRQRFGKETMAPLEANTRVAILAMEQIENLVMQAQSECRDANEY